MSRGFTLLELMLSVTIIGLITGLTLPVFLALQTQNDTDIAVENIADMLRRGQAYSRANNGDSQWGVRIDTGQATLFKGSSYATRDSTYDEIATLPSATTLSGLNEIVFSKVRGLPSTNGSINLIGTATETITINTKGMVNY